MRYCELQTALKTYRKSGLTTIKLNAKKEILQAEYDRIQKEFSTPQEPKVETKPEPQEEQVLPPAQRPDYPQMLEGLTVAAQSRGYADNEAKTFARKFFKCWEDNGANLAGYTIAYNRYLHRLCG